MFVNELVDTIDHSLVLELYGTGQDGKLAHLGTYNLDDETLRAALLDEYGQETVKRKDLYKAYILVYI